jgi:hypothetical protein
MSSETVVNIFGETVPTPAASRAPEQAKAGKSPKPIRIWSGNPRGLRQDQMTPEDKRLYARESQKLSRAKEAEEEARKLEIQLQQQRDERLDTYGSRSLEEGIPYPTWAQEIAISAEADKLADAILSEVGQDRDVDRIDEEVIRTVAALNFGFAKGYIEPNKSGLHVAFRFVDLAMADVIAAVNNPQPSGIPRYDRPWNTSKSFIQAYKSALKSSLDLCEKFPNLVERNYVLSIRDEWNKICADEATISLPRRN